MSKAALMELRRAVAMAREQEASALNYATRGAQEKGQKREDLFQQVPVALEYAAFGWMKCVEALAKVNNPVPPASEGA